jgi:hypothetical protein
MAALDAVLPGEPYQGVIPENALARLAGDPCPRTCRFRHGFPIIAKAISGMTAKTNARKTTAQPGDQSPGTTGALWSV